MFFDLARLQDILPHRHPFLLPERVVVEAPGAHGVGYRFIHPDDPFLAVEEDDTRRFPWILALEMIVQTGAVVSAAACMEEVGVKPPEPGFLVGVQMRGVSAIAAGKELAASVRIIKKWGRFIVGEGEALSEGRVAVSSSFTLKR